MYWETLNAFNQSSTQNLKVVNSATKKRPFRDAQLPIAHIASHSSLSLSQALVRISLWARFRRRTRKTRPFSLRCFSQSLIGFSAQNPLLLDDILDTLSSQGKSEGAGAARVWIAQVPKHASLLARSSLDTAMVLTQKLLGTVPNVLWRTPKQIQMWNAHAKSNHKLPRQNNRTHCKCKMQHMQCKAQKYEVQST